MDIPYVNLIFKNSEIMNIEYTTPDDFMDSFIKNLSECKSELESIHVNFNVDICGFLRFVQCCMCIICVENAFTIKFNENKNISYSNDNPVWKKILDNTFVYNISKFKMYNSAVDFSCFIHDNNLNVIRDNYPYMYAKKNRKIKNINLILFRRQANKVYVEKQILNWLYNNQDIQKTDAYTCIYDFDLDDSMIYIDTLNKLFIIQNIVNVINSELIDKDTRIHIFCIGDGIKHTEQDLLNNEYALKFSTKQNVNIQLLDDKHMMCPE
jgi:hypothetical protein